MKKLSKKRIMDELTKTYDAFKVEVIKTMDLKTIRNIAYKDVYLDMDKIREKIIFEKSTAIPYVEFFAPVQNYRYIRHNDTTEIFGGNFNIIREPDCLKVYSYRTLILEHNFKNKEVYFDNNFYSKTTSKIQNKIKNYYGSYINRIKKVEA